MSQTTLRLILLVSAAHALVHILELALPGVEQQIATDYGFDKDTSSWLAFAWRFPWGVFAIAAGWLTDRFGAERTLALYLIGCAVLCGVVGCYVQLPVLFVTMALMGTLASIYHPAGLALISHEVAPHDRARALGIHGVFGSIGIGGAPLLAAIVLGAGFSWRTYYWLLGLLCCIVGLAFCARVRRSPDHDADVQPHPEHPDDATAQWGSFAIICFYSFIAGFAYAAMMSFLPRYLGESGLHLSFIPQKSTSAFLAGGVLLVGCVGQYSAGRFARPATMERQLAVISLIAAAPLSWMAIATGSGRVVAAALYALVMFMLQPIYNTLVAKYTPAGRRSLCYGLTFAIGLGMGSCGAVFMGYSSSDLMAYGTLSALAVLQSGIGWVLWIRHRP